MNKIVLLIVVFVMSVLFLSCKKDRTCTCNVQVRLQNHTYADDFVVYQYSDITHSQARKKCSAEKDIYNATQSLNFMTGCELN